MPVPPHNTKKEPAASLLSNKVVVVRTKKRFTTTEEEEQATTNANASCEIQLQRKATAGVQYSWGFASLKSSATPTAGPETYCRLCLGKDNLRGVFREENPVDAKENGVATLLQVDELLEKIYECTNIKLSPSVDADCAICRSCLQAVEDFYHFRVRSKRVNDLIQVNSTVAGRPAMVAGAAAATPSIVSDGTESLLPSCKGTTVPARDAPSIAVEAGVRPHRCRYCPKSFRTLAALTEHGNRAHVSSRQHHCPNCLAQFQHAPSLARHMRSRSCFAFSKYRCRVCSESFPDRQQWADHIRVHAKDFPFQCPDCWSQFKHKATLRRHANTVHLLVQC